MNIPPEKQFHFRDGTSIGSLDQLKEKLEGISYQEFYHHVNDEKNDFANWVRYVLRDEDLADDLEKVTSIVETVEIIGNYLQPHPVEDTSEDLQTKIEDELGVHVPVEDVPTITPNEAAEIEEESDFEEAPEEPEPARQLDEHMLTQHDYTRLIVKDFMYGLIFGLIIGLILGRILSF